MGRGRAGAGAVRGMLPVGCELAVGGPLSDWRFGRVVMVQGACEGVKASECGGSWDLGSAITVIDGGLTLDDEVDGILVWDAGSKGWEFEAAILVAIVLSWTDFLQRL
jgi:hypothetical protein